VIFRPRHYLAGTKSDFLLFCIGDCGIEIVDQCSHATGHVVSSKGNDLYDILRCRNSFIAQANMLLCQFDKLDSFKK